MIFVNLPVKDLQRTTEFFTALGFHFNPEFTDDTATSMVIADNIFAMMMVENRFRTFSKKHLCDTATHSEVLLALSCSSRQEVDDMADKAVAAGGAEVGEPQDHGFMYQRAFEDPDGHIWELVYMEQGA